MSLNKSRSWWIIYRLSWLDKKQAKNKKKKIPINKKDKKCFQHAVTVALNHEEIKKDLRIIANVKPVINKYNWEGKNFP